jgi:hypothetical protein
MEVYTDTGLFGESSFGTEQKSAAKWEGTAWQKDQQRLSGLVPALLARVRSIPAKSPRDANVVL